MWLKLQPNVSQSVGKIPTLESFKSWWFIGDLLLARGRPVLETRIKQRRRSSTNWPPINHNFKITADVPTRHHLVTFPLSLSLFLSSFFLFRTLGVFMKCLSGGVFLHFKTKSRCGSRQELCTVISLKNRQFNAVANRYERRKSIIIFRRANFKSLNVTGYQFSRSVCTLNSQKAFSGISHTARQFFKANFGLFLVVSNSNRAAFIRFWYKVTHCG